MVIFKKPNDLQPLPLRYLEYEALTKMYEYTLEEQVLRRKVVKKSKNWKKLMGSE